MLHALAKEGGTKGAYANCHQLAVTSVGVSIATASELRTTAGTRHWLAATSLELVNGGLQPGGWSCVPLVAPVYANRLISDGGICYSVSTGVRNLSLIWRTFSKLALKFFDVPIAFPYSWFPVLTPFPYLRVVLSWH